MPVQHICLHQLVLIGPAIERFFVLLGVIAYQVAAFFLRAVHLRVLASVAGYSFQLPGLSVFHQIPDHSAFLICSLFLIPEDSLLLPVSAVIYVFAEHDGFSIFIIVEGVSGA